MASFDSVPLLIERDKSSVTVGWTAVSGCTAYELEMKENDASEYRSLSSSIQKNYVKKKNLLPNSTYIFRVRSKVNAEWTVFSSDSIPLSVTSTEMKQLDPPQLTSHDSVSVTLAWTPVAGATGYNIRYRLEDEPVWEYVSSVLAGTILKKKNLLAEKKYCFAVKPVLPTGEDNNWEYSLGSSPVTIAVLSRHFKSILPSTLKTKTVTGSVSTAEALAGKVVAIYFSAHWCGPCRNFTPQLASLYQSIRSKKKDFEVIFCSADHSEEEFDSYYSENMPNWLAIPYDESEREAVMSMYKVKGIPRLLVLAPNGNILCDNAVQEPLSMDLVDQWIRLGSGKRA